MNARKLLAVALLVLMAVAVADAQTAEEIIAKAVDAMGGAEVLKAINTSRVIGRFSIPSYGLNLPMEVFSKRPNKKKIMLDFEGQQFIRCTNGTVAWQINPMDGITEPTPLNAYSTRLFNMTASSDAFYFDLEARGVKTEFIGKEIVEGEELNHLRYSFPGDFVFDLFFDARTGLPRLSIIVYTNPDSGAEVELKTLLSDYRETNGITIAFREENMEGEMQTIFEIISLETNIEVDDSIFEIRQPEGN
ncbi:MAG TPA: hypothetical protein VMX35_08015 [Acidobacteriota bacterium]|nr:hypothetical protein [Acidobacteriota bacterium]